LPDFPLSLYGGTAWRSWTAESDETGSFRLVGIPCAGGALIRARFRDVASASILVPDHSVDDARIELKPTPRVPHPILRGVVVDGSGAAVGGRDVRLGQTAGRSDAQGAFEISVDFVDPGTPLTATHPNHAAAVIEAFDQQFDQRSAGLDGIVLRLGGTPET